MGDVQMTTDEIMGMVDRFAMLHADARETIEGSDAVYRRMADDAKRAKIEIESAIEALQADAARYAFAKTIAGQVVCINTFREKGASYLDAEIDAAMALDKS
jgi:adenylate kinase